MYIYFLVGGIVLSSVSKALQFSGKEDLGNVLVFPAASLFVLTLLSLFPDWVNLWSVPQKHMTGILFAGIWIVAMALVQFMLLKLVSDGNFYYLLLLIPISILITIAVYLWRNHF